MGRPKTRRGRERGARGLHACVGTIGSLDDCQTCKHPVRLPAWHYASPIPLLPPSLSASSPCVLALMRPVARWLVRFPCLILPPSPPLSLPPALGEDARLDQIEDYPDWYEVRLDSGMGREGAREGARDGQGEKIKLRMDAAPFSSQSCHTQ